MTTRTWTGVGILWAAILSAGCADHAASDAATNDASQVPDIPVQDTPGTDGTDRDVAMDHTVEDASIDAPPEDTRGDALTDARSDTLLDAPADGAIDASGDAPPDGGDGGCAFPPVAATGTYNEAPSVVFSQPGGVDVTMDIVWPMDPGPHPLVVLLHPGGWVSGSAGNVYGAQHRLVSLGYTVAAPNYRLSTSTDNHFPAAVQDVRCAVRWLRANASTYNLDPSRVIVWGLSSGANLGAMIATIPSDPELDSNCGVAETDVSLRGFIGWYGVYDLRSNSFGWDGGTDGGAMDPALLGYVTTYLGSAPESDPVLAARASPLLTVSAGTPMSLLVAGTDDPLVPVQQSREMVSALQSATVPVTYIETPHVSSHSLNPFVAGTPVEWSCASLDFLATNFR